MSLKALTEALTSALPIDDDIEDQPLPGDVEIPDIKSKPKAPLVLIPKDEPANDPEYNPNDKKTDKPKPVLPIHPQETPNPKTNPKTEPTTQPDPKPDPKPNTKPQPKPDPKSDPQKAPNNDPKPNVESQPKPGSNNDPKPNQEDKQSPNFELPAFCDWATWFCKDDTKPDDNTKVEVKELDFDYEAIARRPYIVLPKTCPANPTFSFDMPFVAQKLSLDFPLHLFCQAFAMFKIVVILFGYIKALSIIGQGD